MSVIFIVSGIAIVCSLIVALTFFNSVMTGWCNCCCRSLVAIEPVKNVEHEDLNVKKISTVKYKHKKENETEETNDETECVLCLSPFEDGECIRQLPACNHVFHVSCIDVWLSWHLDCPLCRSPVDCVACIDWDLTSKAENSDVVDANNNPDIEFSTRGSRRVAGSENMV